MKHEDTHEEPNVAQIEEEEGQIEERVVDEPAVPMEDTVSADAEANEPLPCLATKKTTLPEDFDANQPDEEDD